MKALGPIALLGWLIERPFVWGLALCRGSRRAFTVILMVLVTIPILPPARADFLGFDLIPLSGQLLIGIRNFYLRYQEQIQNIKRMALAYYTYRQLDVAALRDALGDLAELESTEAIRFWINSAAAGYAEAMTDSGSDSDSAEHDGTLEKGLRYRVTDADGEVRYLTTSEAWNELFNPYSAHWDPSTTQETYLILRMRERWLDRELSRYRRAIITYRKLASLHQALFVSSIENTTVTQAVSWALAATVAVDEEAARFESWKDGTIKAFIESRVAYWTNRYLELKIELNRIRRTVSRMAEDMTLMERRAMAMVNAKLRKQSFSDWNYLIPQVGFKRRFPENRRHHWRPWPRGWS